MSTTAGIAMGLAVANSGRVACESAPMSAEAKNDLAVWVVGMVVAALVGGVGTWWVTLRYRVDGWDVFDCLPMAGLFTMAWAIGYPVVSVVWWAVAWVFAGGAA